MSAVSIIAKVFRDKMMIELCKDRNQCYNWSKNKGYTTHEHLKSYYVLWYDRISQKPFVKTL